LAWKIHLFNAVFLKQLWTTYSSVITHSQHIIVDWFLPKKQILFPSFCKLIHKYR
jgi:hypothetical protein